ncbi:MAG: hypothetical protein ABSH50_05500 [Bryobacteraceae bacterium]
MSRLAAAFRQLVEALSRSGIPYLVVGSTASGIHGIYRTSFDVDLVADIASDQIPRLVRELGPDFYADAGMIREALYAQRSFNLIHFASSYKFDIFPLLRDAYQQRQFSRRVMKDVVLDSDTALVPVATAEDTLLMKLVWYRSGGEVSERQWNDVRGIVAVQAGRLDLEYLNRWAAYLKVTDLLEEVLHSA